MLGRLDALWTSFVEFFGSDPRYVRGPEYVLGGCTMLLGFVLILPYDTIGTGAAFETMRQILPEVVWGLLIMLLGLLKIIGARFQLRWLRTAASFVGLAMWFALTVSFWAGSPRGWLWAVCTIPTVFNLMTFLRMGYRRRAGRT